MTCPRPGAAAYRRRRTGPDPLQAFTVLEGVAVVIGLRDSVILPAGATWPGTAQLPPSLQQAVQPHETVLLCEGRVVPWQPSPLELQFGVALVLGQLLRSPRLTPVERQALLVSLHPAPGDAVRADNLDSVGAALASTRHSLRQLKTG